MENYKKEEQFWEEWGNKNKEIYKLLEDIKKLGEEENKEILLNYNKIPENSRREYVNRHRKVFNI